MPTPLIEAIGKVGVLMHILREGTFYEDHDESMQALGDAEEALLVICDLAITGEQARSEQ